MNKLCKCGNTVERLGSNRCNSCKAAYQKAWRAQHRDAGTTKKRIRIWSEKRLEYQKKYRRDNPDKRLAWDTQARSNLGNHLRRCLKIAKRNKQQHACHLVIEEVTELWEKQAGRCAITGMTMAHRPNDLRSASIDRIDSNGIYEVGNVHLVCRWVNFAKSNRPLAEIKKILEEFKNNP